MPAVSILLPVRNGMPDVERAVGSIRGQTLTSWELIAVNDGSTDGTASFLDAATKTDPRIRVIRTEPNGLLAALNTGLAHAGAPLIARMDADDVSHPDRLRQQAAFLDAQPEVGLVSCRVAFGGDAKASAGYAAHVRWLNGLLDHDSMALNRFIDAPVAHPSVMFRRQLTDDFGPYAEGGFPEDHELWLRWFERGVRFAKLPDMLLTWHDSATRLSRNDPRYSADAFAALKCRYLGRHLAPGFLRGRRVWLWGAGRVTRKRFRALGKALGGFAGFIDPDPRKIGSILDGAPVRSHENLPSPKDAFLLSAVANRHAREDVRAFLTERGWTEGVDFLCVA